MLRSYLKIAVRNLRHNPGYASINVFGLAVGMAACLLIALYVRSELAYDRYHANADRIHRIVERFVPLQENQDEFVTAAIPPPWAPALVDEFPEIETAVRVLPGERVLLRHGESRFYEDAFAWTDSSIFDVFSLSLVRGDPATALNAPNGIVMSESAARRYFGDENPLGKTLSIDGGMDDGEFEVTGVMEDMPMQSHVRFEFLSSMAGWDFSDPVLWIYHNYYTYLLLREDASAAAVEAKLPDFLDRHMGPALTTDLGSDLQPFLQPLTRIHLYSAHLNADIAPQSDIRYVYVFSIVALFVLLIACVNFMNLTTARSVNRAKEVGMRKVLGAQRVQLVRQFLGEAVLQAFIALMGALLLVWMLRPTVNRLSGGALDAAAIDGPLVIGLIILTLAVGLLAGAYPALYLSSFRPAHVIKRSTGPAAGGIRKSLVAFQFAISIVLIVGTLVVWKQLDYMQAKNLGFDEESVIVLPIRSDMIERYGVFRERLLAEPVVREVGAASNRPGRTVPGNLIRFEGQEPRTMRMLFTDLHLAEALHMEIVDGRNLSTQFPSDRESGFLINEAAAAQAGWHDPVGKNIAWVLPNEIVKSGTIVGVVRDFHIQTLHTQIVPLVMFVWPTRLQHIFVRLGPGESDGAIAAVEENWHAVFPDNPFPFEFEFLSDHMDRLYDAEQKLARIFGYFSVLTIVIACLGLFGLAAYTAESRTREIGVRKVLGASIARILTLLSGDFLRPVAMGIVVAAPVCYFVMQRWLEEFAYRIDLTPSVFLIAGALTISITLLTVGFQSVKAALADPVTSLRHE